MSTLALPDLKADHIPSHLRSQRMALIEDLSVPSRKPKVEKEPEVDNSEDEVVTTRVKKAPAADQLSQLISLKSAETIRSNTAVANSCLEWLYDIGKEPRVNVTLTLQAGIHITVQAVAVFEDPTIESVTLLVARNTEMSLSIPQALQLSISWNGKTMDCIYMGRLHPGEKFPFNLMTFLVQSPQ